jgi:hypothetical protein
MQRLYDYYESMAVLGHDDPFVQHNIDLIIEVFTHAS